MVKKLFSFFTVCIFLILIIAPILVQGQTPDEPSVGGNPDELGGDVKKITEFAEGTPLTPDGQIDKEKLSGYKSKADERIESIDKWLEDNVGWLKYAFHMKPEISFLFFVNIYFVLLFFTILVLNSKGLFFFLNKKSHNILFGLSIFSIFLILKLYYGLATIISNVWKYIWDVLIPSSIILGVILIIILIVLLFFIPPLLGSLIQALASYLKAKEETKRELELAANTEAMNSFLENVKPKE